MGPRPGLSDRPARRPSRRIDLERESSDEQLKVYIGGKLFDKADAKISVYDHGLLYGDGVFEGIRAYSGRVFRLEEHVDRLYDSARGRSTCTSR